jgi:hypothetical protein
MPLRLGVRDDLAIDVLRVDEQRPGAMSSAASASSSCGRRLAYARIDTIVRSRMSARSARSSCTMSGGIGATCRSAICAGFFTRAIGLSSTRRSVRARVKMLWSTTSALTMVGSPTPARVRSPLSRIASSGVNSRGPSWPTG